MKHIINKLSALILMLMCVSATMQAEMVYHWVCQPTNKSRGFTRPCWEYTNNGTFYTDGNRNQEIKGLELAKAVTYAKLPENPVYECSNFDGPNDEHLEDENLDLNWAVSTTFDRSSFLLGETHSVQFKVKNHVFNARIVWFSDINQRDYDYYNVFITVKRGGDEITFRRFEGYEANGVCVCNLGSNVQDGDIVEFKVERKSGNSGYTKSTTFKASLEYTFLTEDDIVQRTPCAPTPTTRGFNYECWEDKETGQIYNADLTQELINEDLAKTVIYPKLPENLLMSVDKFSYSEPQNHQDVNFNHSAVTSYFGKNDLVRSAEFLVIGDNVSNARLVWYRHVASNAVMYAGFTVKIFVNGVLKYEQISENWRYSEFNVYLLSELKKGDVVKFEVTQHYNEDIPTGEVSFYASLEYIGTFDNDDSPIVLHGIQNPTTSACGYSKMCWENRNTGKFYWDEACTKELSDEDLAKTVLYAKLPESPITATYDFNKSESERELEVDLNWAGVTTYFLDRTNLSMPSDRFVEFKPSAGEGNIISNARLVWFRNLRSSNYGSYDVVVSVNGRERYRKGQDDSEGIFIVSLPDLKKDDIVRFKVKQTHSASWTGDVNFKACLEYNVVPCTHEYTEGSVFCSICGYMKEHDHTYNETETCSLCGYVDPDYIVMTGYVGKENLMDIKWELNRYNVLTYTGTGEMENFNNDHNEWRNENKNVVTKLVISEGITKIGDSDGANGYFDQMANLTDVYLMSDKKITTADNAFGNNLSNVTLHVNNSLLKWAQTTSPWNRFGTIVPLGDYNVEYTDAEGNKNVEKFDIGASNNTFTLTDGCKQLAIYEDIPLQTLTYTRNFSAANTWQALYVPFEMEYNDWADKFDVAAISNFHEYTNNGVTEKIDLEVRYVKKGKLRANTPYLIRAKAAGEQTIVLNDVTLMATESKSIDCNSTMRKYTFTGTYDAIDKLKTNGYIFLSGGSLSKANNDTDVLKPMRWYLTIEDYFSVTGNAAPALAKPISINVIGEDEATDIEDITVVSSSVDAKASGIYSITGVKLDKPQRGINIINGKKIVVK